MAKICIGIMKWREFDKDREKLEIFHAGSFKLMSRFMFRIKLCKTIQRLITTVMKGYSFTQQFLRALKYHFVLGIVNFPDTSEALLYFRQEKYQADCTKQSKDNSPF